MEFVQRQFSVGGAVYRKEGDRVLWLLRRSSQNPGYVGSSEWSLPKGWIDDEDGGIRPGPKTLGKKRATKQEMEKAALREVREEGGVDARVVSRLGEVRFFFVNHEKEKVFKTVIFFLMTYVRELSDGFGEETSEVRWVETNETRELLDKRRGEWELLEKGKQQVLGLDL